MIRHLVHMNFPEAVTDAQKHALYARLSALSERLDGIADFQHRVNVSVEAPLVRGFRDMFWFDFRDAMVRDAYLIDPVHQAIGADIVALTEGGTDGVFVCDIEL